jgi:hypothetical protein
MLGAYVAADGTINFKSFHYVVHHVNAANFDIYL